MSKNVFGDAISGFTQDDSNTLVFGAFLKLCKSIVYYDRTH